VLIVALAVALSSGRRISGGCGSGFCLPAIPDLTHLPAPKP
jgi:hypothetical protein